MYATSLTHFHLYKADGFQCELFSPRQLNTTGTGHMDSVFHWLFLSLELSSRPLQRCIPKSSILNKIYNVTPSTND